MMPGTDLDPVHTRLITVEALAGQGPQREVRGRLVDLRHRGTTWVGSRPTRPGVVHDMSARMTIDGDGRVLQAEGAMTRVPFDGNAETEHESCRDILGNVAGLAGAVVGEDFGRTVSGCIGGRLGCYHLTSLIRVMQPIAIKQRAIEQGMLRRAIRVDGWRRAGSEIMVHAALEDAGHAVVPAADVVGAATARLEFAVALADLLQLREVRVEHRHSPLDPGGAWVCERTVETAKALAGMRLLPGFGRQLGELASRGGCEPVLELAQIVSTVSSQILLHLARPEAVDGDAKSGGRAADTCVMWRQGGPLANLRIGYEAG